MLSDYLLTSSLSCVCALSRLSLLSAYVVHSCGSQGNLSRRYSLEQIDLCMSEAQYSLRSTTLVFPDFTQMLTNVADASAAPSTLPNSASAVNGGTEEEGRAGAKIALEDLFKDVWMAEEEEAEPDAATPSRHVPHTEVCCCCTADAISNLNAYLDHC